MPTRSKPIVWWTSRAWAIATLVPTPSAEVASTGWSKDLSAVASKSPAKPPIPPIISGRRAFSTQTFISSTALSPASIETPAASYVAPVGCCSVIGVLRSGRSGPVERVRRTAARQGGGEAVDVGLDRGVELEQVLAEVLGVRQRHRVDAVEAGSAEVRHRDLGGLDELFEGDVPERVRVDGAADLVGGEAVGDQLRAGGEVDAVEARPLHRR